ncbi:MAG: hypothetical protein LLG20_11080 [Acidobacteriales bacterium]|nr:hypothetical protein [Terriglobales bacterium]
MIFDTNIGQTLLRSDYRPDLDAIRNRINSRFQVVISPQTYLEVFSCVCGGDEAHFEEHRNRLRFLVGRGSPKFLPFPIVFAVAKTLRLRPPSSELGPDDFRKWLRIVLHARDQRALFDGDVQLPDGRSRLRFGFDPSVHLRQHEEGISQHREFMEAIRDNAAPIPPADAWAAATAVTIGHSLDQQQAAALAAGLDAAYQYHRELCGIVANGTYKFEKHRGDWIDWQQLFYLCDPNVYLLTGDGGLQQRIARSPQKSQLLDLRDFLRRLGFTPKH